MHVQMTLDMFAQYIYSYSESISARVPYTHAGILAMWQMLEREEEYLGESIEYDYQTVVNEWEEHTEQELEEEYDIENDSNGYDPDGSHITRWLNDNTEAWCKFTDEEGRIKYLVKM